MMINVDGLTRRIYNIVAQHLYVATLLHSLDTTKRSDAYNSSIADVAAPTRLAPSDAAQLVLLPILTTSLYCSMYYRQCSL